MTGRSLLLNAAVSAAVLAATMAACSWLGVTSLSPWDDWAAWRLRLERIAAAAVVGAGLSVSGAALQSLLRNPLASPFVLGISSGAGVGVLAGMTLLGGALWGHTPAMAAVGALATVGVVYLAAQRGGRLSPLSLVLTGVIVNAFNGALMLFLWLYNPDVLADYIAWAMGSIPEDPGPLLLASAAGVVLAGWVFLLSRGYAFNVQSLGDDVAASSGVNVPLLRIGTFVAASLTTAAAVALAGPVGFVGLIVPHVCRLILGSDHRRLLVVSGFVGGAFLVAADTFCRSTVFQFRQELPVGAITALCGGPFFIYLLRRRTGEGAE